MHKDEKFLYHTLYHNQLTTDLINVVNNAIGRNVVIFDKKAEKGEIAARLLALITNFDKSVNWLHLLVKAEDRHSLESELTLYGMDLHLNIVYLNSRYDEIKKYYLNYPGSTLASDDKDMIILVDPTFTQGLIGSY